MDIGTALSVAQTLFAALQCSELKKICSFFGKESELVEFKRTVDTVKAVLLDAQDKEVVTNKHEAELYIQRLKDAVYDADDLLDEFVTIAEQKQLMKDGKVSEKLQNFFSRRNPFAAAHKMSREVKKIKKTLDSIANDHSKFGFSVDSQLIRRRREETCSYVYERNIVGREDDVEKIIGLLLDSNVKEDVSFLTIVGIGGLGKTALAQLLFNDTRVTSAFPLRLWTCVSDHEQEELDVEGILRKILASSVGKKDKESTMDLVQRQLRAELASKKYLLVLDDVWTENRNQWKYLVDFLVGGQKGSWVVVTTRSHETARVVGGGQRHELQGLSKENSWLLFEKTAFGSEQSNPHEDLSNIGREIVEQCAGVPLAIRVAGSLLYGQDKTKWLSFHKIGLINFKDSQKNIMPILKLSYDQLESPLKSCFTYCALFPKDSEIEKESLISLWMAQGFIVPLDESQAVDDAAEEYFSILLRRCFFQEIKHDEYGGISSCKMHDLMHDVAQQVAGKEICITNSVVNVDEKVRHLALTRGEFAQPLFTKTHIRSYLLFGRRSNERQKQSVKALLTNWVCLRALDLSYSSLESLPESIGGLLHLRFLNLSGNNLKVLPKSITKLYNLEILKLVHCSQLEELPKEFSKLVKLRVLDLTGYDIKLTHMPSGMGKLSCLHTMSDFLVSSTSWKELFDELEELKGLKCLKGKLNMTINFPYNDLAFEQKYKREGAYLRNLECLSAISILFKGAPKKWGEEACGLVEELQPPSSVKMFRLSGFNLGKESYARGSNFKLPPHSNLIRLELSELTIEHVICLGNLPHLKILQLWHLSELEYIIDCSCPSAVSCEPAAPKPARLSTSNAEGLSLFPSLEELFMINLQKLEGWRRSRIGVGDNHHLTSDSTSSSLEPLLLPRLKVLFIEHCQNLVSILQCPVVEELKLKKFNKGLQIIRPLSKEVGDEEAETSTTTTLSSSYPSFEIMIDDMKGLNSLPIQALQCLRSLMVDGDEEVESLGEVGEMFFRSMPSLQYLYFQHCPNLRSVSGGLEHLTSLEALDITNCPNLRLLEEERQDGIDAAMTWHSLHHLTLSRLPQLVELPNWMQFLVNLQFLYIFRCQGLESVPIWMPKLTSLRKLEFIYCSTRLNERCRNSTGEDWPLIKHIPHISVRVDPFLYHSFLVPSAMSK